MELMLVFLLACNDEFFFSGFEVNFSLLFSGKKIEWGLKQTSHSSLV